MRPWYRRLLAWLRLEDEHGVLSLTTVGFVAGIVCILSGRRVSLAELATFALGMGAYHAKRHREYKLAAKAMDGAQAVAVQQLAHQHDLAKGAQGEHLDALGAKVKDLADKLAIIATPEKMEQLRAVLRGR